MPNGVTGAAGGLAGGLASGFGGAMAGTAGGGAAGLLGMANPWLGALMGLGGLFGANKGLDQARGDITGLAQFNPHGFSGGGVNVGFGGDHGVVSFGPELQLLQALSTGAGAQGFGGGMFNNPIFQQAFQGNNLGGAFQNAQSLGTGGAGLLGGLGAQALAGSNNIGGMQQNVFDRLTALARPNENMAANRLLDSQFSRGIGGSTQGAIERAQAANQFLTAGDSRALQALQFAQGQQQQDRSFGAGALGQAFGQQLSSGQTRLQNALGLFGFGNDLRNQGISQGFQAQQGVQGNAALGLQAVLGALNAEAGRIGATGLHAQALGQLGQAQGGLLGGFMNSLGGFL